MLKVVSLFSGIGAFEKALKDAEVEYEVVNFCEVDKFASVSYNAIHGEPLEKNLGDVTKVEEDKLPDYDMLTWGSPCQDFSVAGVGAGSVWECQLCNHKYNPLTVHYTKRGECPECGWGEIDKTRSSLLVEGLRILRAKKPRFSIYENVKNMIGKANKATFDMFIKELEEYGYNNYWKVLNAKDYGIPQNRERVFVVSILKEDDTGTFIWPEPFDNGLRLKDFLEDEVDEKYYINQEKTEKLLQSLSSQWQGVKVAVPCLTPDRTEKRQNGRRFKDDGDPMFTLTVQDRHGVLTGIDTSQYRIRKLTPREYWRLMGFKDEDFDKAEAVGISNSQLYKQAANSIVVGVLVGIIKGLPIDNYFIEE